MCLIEYVKSSQRSQRSPNFTFLVVSMEHFKFKPATIKMIMTTVNIWLALNSD